MTNEAAERLRGAWTADFRLPLDEKNLMLNAALTAERRATVEHMVAMRQDWNTMPHAEFPKKWPDWKEYEVVLPTYCGCGDCRLWRSGS